MEILRTDNSHKHFIALTAQLDADFNKRYGFQQSKYDKHNKIQPIDTVIIGYVNKIPAACGCFKKFDSRTAEIKRMFVRMDFRRKGLASSVLDSLETWALELGFFKAVFETGKGQPEAISFYEKNRYAVIDNYGPYKAFENSICMEKLIDVPA